MMRDSDVLAEQAWARFDALVKPQRRSPWVGVGAERRFVADTDLLTQLLEVPLDLGLSTATGIPAKAVDVWIAAELRRAGFGADEIWPRPTMPRVLPRDVAALLERLPQKLRSEILSRLTAGKLPNVSPSDARILGKAYVKQVDVVLAHWARGPEILISTKRMGSSLGRNAFNRVEESYGDAHNLRGRHPLAVLGYMLVVRGAAIDEAAGPARRLFDLVGKMGEDKDGYDSSCVIVVDWVDRSSTVSVRLDDSHGESSFNKFFAMIVANCLNRTPVDIHVRARELLSGEAIEVDRDNDL